MKKNFSIIFNSRNRVGMLTKMLECIERTANDIDGIETIVNFDDDDTASVSSIDELNSRFSFLTCLVNKREHNIHTNVNKMAFMAKGDYIWALGDDCHIMTKDWDVIAIDKFSAASDVFGDRIFMGAVESTSVDKCTQFGWYCDAPILTKEARDGLGYLIHPHFVSVGADVATWKIYSSVNRIVDLRNIIFDHVTHNTVDACQTKDQTQLEYLERMNGQVFNPFSHDYSEDIKKIKELIDE